MARDLPVVARGQKLEARSNDVPLYSQSSTIYLLISTMPCHVTKIILSFLNLIRLVLIILF